MTVKEWTDTIVTLLVIGFTLFFFKNAISIWAKGIYTRLDQLIDLQKTMLVKDAIQDERLKQTESRLDTHESRLNSHSERIRRTEMDQASCARKKE